MKSKWALSAIALFVGLGIYGFAILMKNSQGTNIFKGVKLDQRLGAEVPLQTVFKDETGREVKLGEYFGKKPVVLTLVFYNCMGTCTQMLNGAGRIFKDIKKESLGTDYESVTISINPTEGADLAIQKKESYINLYGLNEKAAGWHFLTGSEENIRAVANAVGFFYTYDAKTNKIVHPSTITILTPSGKVSKYFPGVEYPSPSVLAAIDSARTEDVGGLASVISFNCYSTDANGKVRVNVMNTIKVLGLATLLILGTSIFAMVRKEKSGRSEVPKV